MHQDRPLLGMGLMLASCAVLAGLSAVVKWLGADIPVAELLFFRYAFALLPIGVAAGAAGGLRLLRTQRPLDHALRALFGIASLGLYFLAVTLMPLADATAIVFAAPLFVALLASPLLGERLYAARFLAVVAGLLGVVLIARPGGGLAAGGVSAALGSAVLGALVMIWIRKLSRSERTVTIAWYYNAAGAIVFGAWAAVSGWVSPDWTTLLLLAGFGLLAGVQQFAQTEAFRFADATVLGALSYATLVFAALFGFLFWNEWPALNAVLGGAAVVAGGAFLMYHETRGRLGRLPV